MHKITVTKKEQKFIKSLERCLNKAPDTLFLQEVDSKLLILKEDEEDNQVCEIASVLPSCPISSGQNEYEEGTDNYGSYDPDPEIEWD